MKIENQISNLELSRELGKIVRFPKYFVSQSGKVFSRKYGYGKELKQSESKGYRRVALSRGNKRKIFVVHQLVALAFIPNPKRKPFINHKDGNKRNNNVENLEWVTRAENDKHSREVLGNTGIGKKNSNYGYRKSKFYPDENLRSRLIELGIPRYKHDIVSLGEMLPERTECKKYASEWRIHCNDYKYNRLEFGDTEANARTKMLVYLIENSQHCYFFCSRLYD